jgi:ElaB/YqjD/DUF883 family membrane-anchored ribosome-binding protein
MVDDTQTAIGMLQNRFKIDLSRGGRGGKNVLHNKILSGRRSELVDILMRERDMQANKPMQNQVPQEVIDEAKRIYEELEKSPQTAQEAIDEAEKSKIALEQKVTEWQEASRKRDEEIAKKEREALDPAKMMKSAIKE